MNFSQFKKIILFFFGMFVLMTSCKEKIKSLNSENQKIPRKPNIVLIVTDDQGWGDLSIHGNQNLNTPNIDAIAQNGVSFEHFYVQPVCSPTRAELLTGRHFTRLGVYDTSAGGERLNLEETTLADVLKKAGYHTAAYGKWHNGTQPPYHPNSRGFDDFYGFASGHWGNYFSPMLEHNGRIVKGKGFLADDLTDKGLNFIAKHENEPFFLYMPYNTPHSPMQVPDEYWNRFENKDLTQKYEGSEKEEIVFTKAALAMVENLDFNIGRITQKLKDLDLEEDTIVIFMSDNGPNNWRWNGDMRGRKGSTDEGGVRTPFFIQWKNKIPAGKAVTEIASAIDILPTLTDLTGISPTTKKPMDGMSLKPLLIEESKNWSDRLIYNHWNEKTSVRTQKYRLDNEDRLYHLENDRGQKTDLSEQFPKIVDSLKKSKINWLARTKPMKPETDDRPITLGHPDFLYTQIPARDGIPHGNIKRSNRYPNDSFFTNWKSVNDSITWDIEVLEGGKFEIELFYTLKEENSGVAIEIAHGKNRFITRLTESHDPPLKGQENDRYPRGESYVKDFKRIRLGEIYLQKGRRTLVLKSPRIPGKEAFDFRLLTFKRL